MPKLIIPVKDHFSVRVTYRGSAYTDTIKNKFHRFDLLGRAKESHFKLFFLAGEFQFSGVLLHELRLHRIESKNASEIHFCLGSKALRFSTGEFALVTSLNFDDGPSDRELQESLIGRRLITEYFNDDDKIKLSQLDDRFNSCTEKEDVYKLDLCLLIEGVLLARDAKTLVWTNMLKMVEDVDYFCKYPWGKLSYKKLVDSFNKDMHHQQKLYENKKEVKGQQKEAKYTLYGYVPALQYWAFEAIQQFGSAYGLNQGNRTPRMLSWSSNNNKSISRSDHSPLFVKIDEYEFLNYFECNA